jgi:hypothetical protein
VNRGVAYLRPGSYQVNPQLPQLTCALGEPPAKGDSISVSPALSTVGAKLRTSSLCGFPFERLLSRHVPTQQQKGHPGNQLIHIGLSIDELLIDGSDRDSWKPTTAYPEHFFSGGYETS